MWRVLFLLLTLTPAPALACKCLVTYPVCREVSASDIVFIGVVESVGPALLDPWHGGDPTSAIPVGEIERLQRDGTPAAAGQLKEIYRKILGNLTDADDRDLVSAKTLQEVESTLKLIVARGRHARFKVKTVFREVEDDDDDGKDKDKDKDDDDKNEKTPKDLDIWTERGDCGVEFQKGETYLVYAASDEGSGRLETSACLRTRRLSDAGADLAYLHFYQNGGDASSRIEGFVTAKWNQDRAVELDRVESPLPSLVVGLRSSAGVRYARSDADGRFVFDGLAGGDYEVSVFDPAFIGADRVLVGPQRVKVPAKGCASAVVVVSPWTAGQHK
jgi:hypothetical protein